MPQSKKRMSTRLKIDVLVLGMSLAMIGTGIAIGIFP